MKFKTWVTVALLIVTALLDLILFLTDNILLHLIIAVDTTINVLLLTKYSKICE